MNHSLVDGLLELLLIEELQDEEDELPAERRHPPSPTSPTREGGGRCDLVLDLPYGGARPPTATSDSDSGSVSGAAAGYQAENRSKSEIDPGRVRAYRRTDGIGPAGSPPLRPAPDGVEASGVEEEGVAGLGGAGGDRGGSAASRFGGRPGSLSIARGPGRMRLSKGQYRQSTKGSPRGAGIFLFI
jgi:hypothetical protein